MTTPTLLRLISLKYQLQLEAQGMRSSGGAIRPRIAKEFGLSPRATHEEFITKVEAKIEEVRNA